MSAELEGVEMNGISLRWGLWAGPAYVLATFVGNSLSSAGESGKTDGAHLLADLQRDMTFGNHLGYVLEVVGFILFFFFLGAVYRVLRRAEGPDGWLAGTAYGAGLASLAVKVGSAAPLAAALYRRDDLDATTARTLVDINGGAFVIDGLLVAVFVLAAALSLLGTGLVARWMAWSGVALGLIGLVTPTAGILDMGNYFPVPFLLDLIWTVVLAVLLVRREQPAS
jgi:hypothetical protein